MAELLLRPSCHRRCPRHSVLRSTEHFKKDGTPIEYAGWCCCNGYSARAVACGVTPEVRDWEGLEKAECTGWEGTMFESLCECSAFNWDSKHMCPSKCTTCHVRPANEMGDECNLCIAFAGDGVFNKEGIKIEKKK